MRAVHTRLDPRPLINDPWGDRLVPGAVRGLILEAALAALDANARARAMAAPDTLIDQYLAASAAYANVIFRTRYTEDALQAAVAGGTRQYVLIGAGFDSFALRRPDFAADLDIFEIDHPATQTLKIERIAACGISLPESVHFIAADLARRSVAQALSDSPFRPDRPAFLSWLGVTMYLTKEANIAALRSIASCTMPGSELAFTYLDEKALESQSESFRRLSNAVAAVGEPFRCGFDPRTVAGELRSCGLTLVEDLDSGQAAARYGRADLHGARRPRFSHLALARSGL
jgi:methyltransferase (TIGR00027 family)